jgi:hypothetical protein
MKAASVNNQENLADADVKTGTHKHELPPMGDGFCSLRPTFTPVNGPEIGKQPWVVKGKIR